MEALIGFGSIIILLFIGYFAGTAIEKRHYKSIIAREKQFLTLPVVTMRNEDLVLQKGRTVAECKLVSGCVAVSVDYFKMFAASLRNLVGGNVVSFESLVDRGRREAILRMKEEAGNADIITNLRLETSPIYRNTEQNPKCITVYAYGTAIRYNY
jgi:uncharacterized protein YbjQ (UPF0145 family)